MSEQTKSIAIANSGINFFDPAQIEAVQRAAGMFTNSELVPDMYREESAGKAKAIANTVIALDMANRIGANPLMVMQNLVIIYGRPSWASKFLISTVNTCGKFETLKFKFNELGDLKDYKYKEYETKWEGGKKNTRLVEKTLSGVIKNTECIAYTTTKGSSDILESSPISIEMAINEGWYTKPGSKWPNMSKQMLMYRAASFWTNAYAPELSMGMKTVEEEQDIIDITHEVVKEAKIQNEINQNANKTPVSMDDSQLENNRENNNANTATPPVGSNGQNQPISGEKRSSPGF